MGYLDFAKNGLHTAHRTYAFVEVAEHRNFTKVTMQVGIALPPMLGIRTRHRGERDTTITQGIADDS